METDVLVATRDHVATITLNRPDKYNAFDPPFIKAIRAAFEEMLRAADVDALVLTGAGKAFCAGGDVTSMRAALEKNPQRLFEDLTEHLHPVIAGIRKAPKPVVAAINGPTAGGGLGLALACDLRIAGPTASFKPAYRTLGIVPDGGLTYFLPRLVGFGTAQRIILRDETVNADAALRLGLIDEIVPAERLVHAAHAEARRLADHPPESFRLTKDLLNLSYLADLEPQLERERRRNAASAKGPWLKEGVAAFFEKREPQFRKARSPTPRR